MSNDITVIQALNHASQNWFNENFDQTDLYNDFEAIWPMWNSITQQWEEPAYGNSKLVVYGNGNIRLHEYYVYDVEETGTYGSGAVYNEDGLTGAQPNGDYARLYAPQSGDQALIVANFGYQAWENAHGDIYLRCYSETGYQSRLYVYVSDNYQDWNLTSRYPQIVSSHSPVWLYCGASKNTFKYIAIAVYRDGAYGSDLRVDSVLVIPPVNHNWADSIIDVDSAGDGYVEDAAYLLGDANDGNFAILHTPDFYDESWVIAEMNVEVAADRYIYLYGCGEDYTYGCLSVSVSNDYQSWTTLCEMSFVDPEPPYWIYCGYTKSPFKYIKIHNYGDYSYGLCIDSVFVTA